jgi:hypothetical protein
MRHTHVHDIPEVPDLIVAYLAGILDGEGSICISRVAPKPPRRPSPQYQLHLIVRMADTEAIMLFHRYFGGRLIINTVWKKKGSKPLSEWATGYDHAIAVLSVLLPYLRIKKTQACLAIQFQSTTCKTHDGKVLSEDVVKLRDEFYQNMGKLNNSHWYRKRHSLLS